MAPLPPQASDYELDRQITHQTFNSKDGPNSAGNSSSNNTSEQDSTGKIQCFLLLLPLQISTWSTDNQLPCDWKKECLLIQIKKTMNLTLNSSSNPRRIRRKQIEKTQKHSNIRRRFSAFQLHPSYPIMLQASRFL